MRTSIALLIVTVLCSFVGLAFADEPECDPKIQAGDVGIYFDPDGNEFSRPVIPYVAFFAYVLAFDLPGGILGYELAVNGFAPLFLLDVQYLGAANQGDVPGEFIVTTGECLSGSGVVQLVRLTLGDFSLATGLDRLICLSGTDPTSFAAFNRLPGYLQCDGGLQPFTPALNCAPIFPAGCSVLNPTFDRWACPLEEASFGTLKAAF